MARQRAAAPAAAAGPGHGHIVDPEAAAAAVTDMVLVVRADKISKLRIQSRKSSKVREFKDSFDGNVKEWLTKFVQEVNTLKRIAGIAGELTKDEIVEFFKERLEYQTVKRLNNVFAAKESPWSWEEVTYDQLKAIMREEYSSKITLFSEVFLQFRPSRLKKSPEMSVAKFTHN